MRWFTRSLCVLFLVPFAIGQFIDLNTQSKGSRMPFWSTDSGSANAYALTTIQAIGSGGTLQAGSCFEFIAAHPNTGASTAVIDGGSTISVKRADGATALSANDILGLTKICYDGTNFRLFGPGAISSYSLTINSTTCFIGGTCTVSGGGGGSNWWGLASFTAPPTSSWTWDNQGSSTTDSTLGSTIYLSYPSNGSDTDRVYYRTVSGAFTVTAAMLINPSPGFAGANFGGGLAVGDGSKYTVFQIFNFTAQSAGIQVRTQNCTTISTGSCSNVLSTGAIAPDGVAKMYGVIWLQVVVDASHITWNYALDGTHWIQFNQVAVGSFLGTITRVGVVSYCNTLGNILLMSWTGA